MDSSVPLMHHDPSDFLLSLFYDLSDPDQNHPKGTHPKFSGGRFSALSRDSLGCYGTRVNILTREKTTVIRLLSPGEVDIHVNLAPSCYRNRDKQSAANFINWVNLTTQQRTMQLYLCENNSSK